MKKRYLLSAVLLASAPGAFAFSTEPRSEYVANRILNTAQGMNAHWTDRATSAGYSVGRNFDMAGPGGRQVAARYAVTVSARSALVIAAKFLPYAGAASLAWALYDEFRIRPVGEGLAWDEGLPVENVQGYCVTGTAFMPCDTTEARARDVWMAALPDPGVDTGNCYPGGPNQSHQRAYYGVGSREIWITGRCGQSFHVYTLQMQAQAYETCHDPAVSPDPKDGKCPTGDYLHPMTADEAADRVFGAPGGVGQNAPNLGDIFNEARNGTPGGVEFPSDADHEVEPYEGNSWPFVQGSTSTTTNPDGTTTTTATGWNFARDPLRKTDVKVIPTVKTNTTDAQGNPTGPGTETRYDPGDGPDPKDPCADAPDRAGCATLGEVPDVDLGTKNISAQVTPSGGFGADNGACPAPGSIDFMGQTMTIDNTLFCDFFSGIRWVVLGVAWLGAAFILIGAFKE